MTLSVMCDASFNYISQIEMGRRMPSFDKIEVISAALRIQPNELFTFTTKNTQKEEKPDINEYLIKMPANIKKELISRLTENIRKNIDISLNPKK